MRTPSARGAPISAPRMAGWVDRFRFYRDSPNEPIIRAWLSRFRQEHRDIAARLLDVVEIKSEREIQIAYRQALVELPGWSPDPAARQGQWVFVGFGGAGESGQSMLRLFREATNMTAASFNSLFSSAADLPARRLTAFDTVVFIDDFSGTGQQVTRTWPILSELIASEATCYLVLTAATSRALERIRAETELLVIALFLLGEAENLFSGQCTHFTQAEKTTIVTYGKRADAKHPRGWGDCGLVFVLSHKTPNNTIPILHANHDRWQGLFPRFLNPERK